MPFEPQRAQDITWAFSTKKQADYATLVPDGNLDQHISLIGADVADLSRTSFSDAARYGKGHEFPTQFRELTRDLRFARTTDFTSLMAGWAAAFGMGSVVTTQPNPVSNPGAYRHVITFSNASASKQVPVTTIYEQLSGQTAFQRKLESLAVADFTITGKAREVAQLQMNLVGSGRITNGSVTVPSLTPVSALDMGGMVFKLGAQGAPTDLSPRLIEFSVKVTQNLDLDNGYHPGSGLFRDRMWMGARRATFDATVFVDAGSTDIFDEWLAAGPLEASFHFIGDAILNGQPETHDCEIKFPAVRLTAIPISAQNDLLVYSISAGENDVYKDAGGTPNEPLQITVTNTVPAYLGT